MVVIIILTIGIVGTYSILDGGQKLSTESENRIRAINIAREWMEAVENIRDTNWLKFSSNYDNCWKVKDYDTLCVGGGGSNLWAGSYILVQSWTLWTLSGTIAPVAMTGATYATYIQQFPIFLDNNGLITHSGSATKCTSAITSNCKTIFTREIQITHPDVNHMKVNSIVTWVDNSKKIWPHVINLETMLTNWKKKFQ